MLKKGDAVNIRTVLKRFRHNMDYLLSKREKTSQTFEVMNMIETLYEIGLKKAYRDGEFPALPKDRTHALLNSCGVTEKEVAKTVFGSLESPEEYLEIKNTFEDVFISEMKRQGGYL